MADAKTTKKATSTKTKGAKDAKVVKSLEQLNKDLLAKQQDLIEARRSHQSGELVNPRVLGTIRKEIARLHTAIRADKQSAKESK